MTSPLLLVVTGPPASGKTSIAAVLGDELHLPVIHKDDIKELLAGCIPGDSLAWSQQLGSAAYAQLFWAASMLIDAGCSCVLEANFHLEVGREELRPLAARSQLVQVVCTGDPEVLMARYLARAKAGVRHPVHRDIDPARRDELQASFARDHRMELDGPAIICDTTSSEPVDALQVAGQIRSLLAGSG